MLVAIFPMLLLIAGLLLYALSANGRVQTIGLWMFVIGLFFFTWPLMGRTVKVL